MAKQQDPRLYIKPSELDYLVRLLQAAQDNCMERFSLAKKAGKLRASLAINGMYNSSILGSAMDELMGHSAGTFAPNGGERDIMPIGLDEMLPPGARSYNKTDTDRMNDILIRACNNGVDSISMEDKEWYQEAAGFPLT